MARNPFTPDDESLNPRSDDGPEEFDLDREGPDPEEYSAEDDDSDTAPCPKCGEQIYDLADQCPHCGEYVTGAAPQASTLNPWILAIGGVLLAAFLLILMFR